MLLNFRLWENPQMSNCGVFLKVLFVHRTELVLCVGREAFESCLLGVPPLIGPLLANQLEALAESTRHCHE